MTYTVVFETDSLPFLLEGFRTLDEAYWPAAGFVDTKLRCFTKLEVGYGEAHFQS